MATSSVTTSSSSLTVPQTRTVFSDSGRVIISLLSLSDRPIAPPRAKVSTYLLDSQGRTTRTLGLTTSVFLPFDSVRSRSSSSSDGSTEESPSPADSDSATSTTDADSSTITPPPATTTQNTPPTSASSIASVPFVPTATTGATPQVTSPPKISTTIPIAVGIAGGVVAFIVAGLLYYFIRRYLRRRARESTASTATGVKGASRRGVEEIRAEKGQVSSPVTIEGFGRPGENDIARTTTLSSPQRLQSHDSQAQRRIPSREDLAPVNPIPEQWLRERDIHSPLPRPPSRAWRGFSDFESESGTQGPLSVTEDYSTNAGEGSVGGYWHETASMREERLYRLRRPGHSPPPSSTPRPSAPINEPPSMSQTNRLPLIREDRVAGLSLLGDNAPQEGQDAATMPSPATGEGEKQDSSGLASNTPLIRNDTRPSQSSAHQ